MTTQIRPIEDGDIPAAAHLLQALATRYILHECPPEAATHFLSENSEAGLRAFIAQGHVYHVAVVEGDLAGFVAVRERHHLFHLFVAEAYQRRGLARALWETARDAAIAAGGDGGFRVNASNMAVGVYEAFGFVRSAPMQSKHGLFYNPMTLTVGPALLPEREWPA
jgi:GNAT superfamily N-acetyltransferase